MHVRLFDRAELVGGDVVRDFVAAWDLAGPVRLRPGPEPERVAQRACPGVPAPGESAARADRRPADRRGTRAAGRPAGAAAAGPRRTAVARRGRGVLRDVPAIERGSAPAPPSRPRQALRRGLLGIPGRRRPDGLRDRRPRGRRGDAADRRDPRGPPPRGRDRDSRRPPALAAPGAGGRGAGDRPRARLVARTTPTPTARSPRTCCARAGSTRRSPPQRAPSSTGRSRTSSGTSWASFVAAPATSTAPPRRSGRRWRARPTTPARRPSSHRSTPGRQDRQSAAFPLPANEAEACRRPHSA